MFHKKLLITLVVFAAAGSAAALAPGRSDGSANAPRTIALITRDGAAGFVEPFETGGQSAATTLGDQLTIATADDPVTEISTIKSLVAEHVAAIAIDTRDPATVKQVLPALAKARAAGVPTLSYETRFPGSPWVNLTSPTQFVHALADSLASQMKQRGQFVIVSCLRSAGAFPIVRTELKLTEAYIKRRYPRMHRVGVAYGDLGNGNVDTHLFNRLVRAHPQMRGLIFLCPGEADNQPPLLVKAHKVGKIFTSGNGDGCPPVDDNWLTSVRLGAEEVVCEGDPAKLGYLTVWAADYLAGGHTFAPGSYNIGGPVGSARYYSRHQELQLDQLITATQANLDQYAGQPCPPTTPWPC